MGGSLREACGIFAIYAPGMEVARLSFFALFALQHRGQESAGIATSDGRRIQLHKKMGLVSQAFDEEVLSHLEGHMAIAHNRYSTTGSSQPANAQPILVGEGDQSIAIGHNGNIVNAAYLQQELKAQGFSFYTSTDSEVIANLILSAPEKDWVGKIGYALRRLQGAYSLVMLTPGSLLAARDPFGVRPLCLGNINGGWVVASESCALDHIGATFVREVEPGEILLINGAGVASFQERSERKALCVFEYIYFARPDSVINDKLLYPTRLAMGARLSQEYPVDADLVIGVPDSATAAGIGYARESGIPFGEGLMKNRYVGRTFIQPVQQLRDIGVQLKFNPLPEVLAGKRVVVVDDSIVRGTTTPRVVNLLRRAGTAEVHLRICAPPIKFPCFFGVDMASRRELVAARKSVDEIRDFVGADSLGYLSLEGLVDSIGLPGKDFCLACFTGNYPIPVQLEMDKLVLENGASRQEEVLVRGEV